MKRPHSLALHRHAWLAAVTLAAAPMPAQSMKIELQDGQVLAKLGAADLLLLGKAAGLASDLTQTSRPLTDDELTGARPIDLGAAKPGLFAISIRGERRVLTDLFFLDVPKGKPLGLTRLGTPTSTETKPEGASPWRKYWQGLDGGVMKQALKNSAMPLLTKGALKAPALLLSCGTAVELPPMAIVCEDQLEDLGVEVVAELVKQSVDVLVTTKKLTPAEGKQLKAAVDAGQAIRSLVVGKGLFDKIAGAAFSGASAATELTTGDTKTLLSVDVAKATTDKYMIALDVLEAAKGK